MLNLKTYEEQKARAERLNLIDDRFFQKVAEDREACEELLQVLLDKPDLKIVENQAQRHLRNVDARSVILDVLCQDENGRLFNIEVQKDDKKRHCPKAEEYQKRVRFNLANMDTLFAEKGLHYHQLPDIYSIFISELDPFQQDCTTYHVQRSLKETSVPVENGIHEIYINTAVHDGSNQAELMKYFTDSNGYHPVFKKLSGRVMQYKTTNKGVEEMSSVFDEYAEEKLLEAAVNLLKKGISADIIAETFPSLSRESILELKEQLEAKVAI